MGAAVNEVRTVAMRLLATREHCTAELNRKLLQKGFEPNDITVVVDECKRSRYLSDERFTEALVNLRRERGNGPVRIRKELEQHQIDAHIIATCLDERDPDWAFCARQARKKRFGGEIPQEFSEKMRQARFLEYRGFSHAQIQQALREDELEPV